MAHPIRLTPPQAEGLYDPRYEHDACGVGFVVNIKGVRSHAVVERGLEVLINLQHRGAFGHTPLSAEEDIPWRCRRLVIGTGADGALPVMQQVRDEARRRKVDLVVLPTAQAIGVLAQARAHTNAILHLTC